MNTPLQVLLIGSSEIEVQIILQELYLGGYAPGYQLVDSVITLQLALQQQWNIVICADQLFGFSPLDALKIGQAAQPDLPFILLSAQMNEDLAVEIIRAGASDYLLKSQIKRLVPAVARELKEAEIRLAKQQAELALSRLAAIVESSEDAIISTDLQGAILTWNRGAQKLYGYPAAEAVGQLLAELIQPQVQPQVQPLEEIDDYRRVVDCRQVVQRHKTGELLDVALTVSLVKAVGDQVEGFAIIARDISEAQRLQRMKDQFISIINHELRTPLTALQGSIELLLTGKLGQLSAQGQRMLEIAANSIDRITHLTGNILDVERLSAGVITLQKQPCELDKLLIAAIDRNQPAADRQGIQLLIGSLPPDQLGVICLDVNWIAQVLDHLIVNAIQFSDPGSSIWLMAESESQAQAAQRRQKQPTALVCCQSQLSPHLQISVKDQGQGIPVDQLETIFDQFQQVDSSDRRRRNGVGLGLAICRSIAQQHQGALWVESKPGQGSTFYLTLPLQRLAVEA